MLNLFAGMLNLSVEVPDLIGGLYGEAAGPDRDFLIVKRATTTMEYKMLDAVIAEVAGPSFRKLQETSLN